jgi:CBS domain-containing protein
MAVDQRNIVICPRCGAENIEGVDLCENCMSSLSGVDILETAQIVAETDLLMPISKVRMSRPRIVGPNQTVREAIAEMRDDPAGAVIVVESGAVVGIFTDRDVLARTASRDGVLDEPISLYMTTEPVVLRETDTMAQALNKMGAGGFRHIPVVREGDLVGVITVHDIMNWVLGRYFD